MNLRGDAFQCMVQLKPDDYLQQLLAAHRAEDAFEPEADDPPAIDDEGC